MKRKVLLGILGIGMASILASCGAENGKTSTSKVGTTTVETTTIAQDTTTETTVIEGTTYNVTDTFKITTAVENGYTYDSTLNKLTINVAGEYTLEGVFNGRIECASALTEKVTLVLNGCTITSDGAAISWLSESSKVEIKAKKDTTNYLVTSSSLTNEESTVQSENNVEFSGKGKLTVTNNQKHGVSASEVLIKGEIDLTVNANIKDGIHAKAVTIESGTITITAEKDAIEAEVNSKGNKGTFAMVGGTLNISGSSVGIKAKTSITFSDPEIDPLGILLKFTNVTTPFDCESITNNSLALTYSLDGQTTTL